MAYKNYTPDDLETIINSPREIAKDPYKLLTSYLFNSVVEAFLADEEGNVNITWGRLIPKKNVDRYIEDCILDFKNAYEQDNSIRIKGQAFTIRKGDDIDYSLTKDIINFRTTGEFSIIERNGIFNVREEGGLSYDERKKILADDRLYYWKVMVTGQTDDGYDQLTDMEIAMYCWAMWIKKVPMSKVVNNDMVEEWWKREYEYFEIPLKDIRACFSSELVENNKLNTISIFSAQKVREWNKKHKQPSIIDTIDDDEAKNKWYIGVGALMMRN